MTYKQIQETYFSIYDSRIKTCWIADVKRKLGSPVRIAYNRSGKVTKYPCPEDKFEKIAKIIKGEI